MWFLLACSDHEDISVKEEDPGYTVGEETGWWSVSVSAYSGCALDPEGRPHGWGDGHAGDGANCEFSSNTLRYLWAEEGRWGSLQVTVQGEMTAVGFRGTALRYPRQSPRGYSWVRFQDLWTWGVLMGGDGRVQAFLLDRDGLRSSAILPSVPGTPETVTLPGEAGAPPCAHWIDDEGAVRSACVDEPYAWPGTGRYVEVVGFLDGLCALREDGDTECDLMLPLPEPPPSGLHGLTAIGTTLCGIQEDGYVWCGETSTVDRPVAHPPPIPLHSLTGVDWTACGLDDETHIVCWGDNRYGQRDPP